MFSGLVAGYVTGGLALILIVAGVGFVVLSFLVYPGLCALVGGLLIFLASRWLAKRRGYDDPPGFPESFRAAYWGYLIALLIDMALVIAGDGDGGVAARAAASVPDNPQTVGEVFEPALLREFASWLWPAVPITMLLLVFMHRMYRGIAGVARALALTVVALPGSLLVPLAILVGWEGRLSSIGTPTDFAAALLAIGILLLVFAVVGGVVAGSVIWLASRRPGGLRPSSPWLAYGTAVMALAIWGAVPVVVMFVVPLFDPFSAHIWEMTQSGGAPGYLLARPWLLPAGVLAFGVLQTPGVLIAARVVEKRLGADRGTGTPRPSATGVTAIAAATTWPLALPLIWMIASTPYELRQQLTGRGAVPTIRGNSPSSNPAQPRVTRLTPHNPAQPRTTPRDPAQPRTTPHNPA